jgi:hypothetical protein
MTIRSYFYAFDFDSDRFAWNHFCTIIEEKINV